MTAMWRKVLAIALAAMMLLHLAGIAEGFDAAYEAEDVYSVEADSVEAEPVDAGDWEEPVSELDGVDLFSPDIYADELPDEVMAAPLEADDVYDEEMTDDEYGVDAPYDDSWEDPNAVTDRAISAPLYDIDDIMDTIRSSEAAGMVLPTEGTKAKADIVMLIDSTGSMSSAINNVINNLNTFTAILDEGDVNYRIAVINFKDATIKGEDTYVMTKDGESWFTDPATVASVLGSIKVSGGGDAPETDIDALGCMLSGALAFRSDASKFAILLTDANYKTYNNYGYTSLSDVTDHLVSTGVCTSVISRTSYKSSYSTLYERTDGIFCNIFNSDFASELIALAEYMKKVVQPVNIYLNTETIGISGSTASFRLQAEIQSSDPEQTIENLTIHLNLPDGVTTASPLEAVIASLEPSGARNFSWMVDVPITADNANYVWSVNATSDDFAVGVVCTAEDTFSVAGSSVAYGWNFGVDSYGFTNSFGGGRPYFVSDDDMNAFIYALDNSLSVNDLRQVGEAYGRGGSLENFLKNDLIQWGGSCYGMALSAALFKIGAMSPASFGGSTTRDLSLSNVESMINIYHMSQVTSISSRSQRVRVGASLPPVINAMYDMGVNILDSSSSQQPYIVRLGGSNSAGDHKYHAVVCVGAEAGTWTERGTEYHRRLFIADPNDNNRMHYIYISDDGTFATYSRDIDYNMFGYRTSSLSELNSYAYGDMTKNYSARVIAGEITDLAVVTASGKAVIIANHLLNADGTVTIIEDSTDDAIEGGSGESVCTFFDIMGASDTYSVLPVDGAGNVVPSGALDTTLYLKDYSASVSGTVGSASVSASGAVDISGASGDLAVTLAANGSPFEFVTIAGKASGDVNIAVASDHIDVSGALSNYTVSNMDTHAQKKNVSVNVSGPATVTMSGSDVVVSVDTNNDGVKDVGLTSDPTKPYTGAYSDSTASYIINADGTATYVKPLVSKATMQIPATVSVNGASVKVTSVAARAFKNNKKLKTLVIGKNVVTIGKSAFEGSKKLATVKGGAKVQTIGEAAFKNCTALKTITLNKYVQKISKNAFAGCKALKTVTIKTTKLTNKNVASTAFKGTSAKATFKCPKKKLAAYKTVLKKAGVSSKAKIK